MATDVDQPVTANDEAVTPIAGRDRLLWLIVAALCLPIAVASIAALFTGWTPASDWALIELRARDVGSGDTPLLGPFSRFGWNHPGPALFWVLAAPYRLLGAASEALLFGAGLVNIAAAVGIGWIAHRRGGLPLLAWTALLTSLFLLGRDPFVLVDPWNPSVVVLPFALLLLLCWSLAEGEHRLVPLTALAASWVVQGHIGFAPLVGASVLWGLGWMIARHRSPDMWRWLLAGAALAAVLWLPPLVEQVTESPGNMTQIVQHFVGEGNDEDLGDLAGSGRVGGSGAAGVFARHLAPVGVWMGASEPLDPFSGELNGSPLWHGVPLMLALGITGLLAWRAKATDAVLLASQTALGLVVGYVATSRIDGFAFPYLFGWLEVLAMFCWLSIGWSAYRLLPESTSAVVDRRGVQVMLGVAALVVLLAAGRSFSVNTVLPDESDAVAALAGPVNDAVDGRTALLSPYGLCLSEVAFGVALQVERGAGDVVVRDDLLTSFGPHRRWTGENADIELIVSCAEEANPEVTDAAIADGLELVSAWDPTPPELAAREDEIRDGLIAELDRVGRSDLHEQVDNQLILYTGPGAGVDLDLLAEYKTLVEHQNQRVTVLLDSDVG